MFVPCSGRIKVYPANNLSVCNYFNPNREGIATKQAIFTSPHPLRVL
jgi:hypothetical protein